MKLELYSKNLMNGISKTVAIMKKLMKLFVLVAAAAMALASCQKNEITGPETQEVHFTIKADIADTKTYITDNGDKTYTPSWSKGDKIGVLFALEENAKAVDFENTAEAGEEATFEGKHAFTVVEGASEVDGYLYAFYPSSAFNKFYSDGGVRLDLKVTQYPTSTSFDPSCDLLIAKPCYYMAEATGEDAEVVIDDMYFARMMSVLRINLNSEFLSNETVKSVSFDADGVDFTGAMKFNLATGEFVGNQSTSQDLSEVKAVYSEEDPIYVAGEKNSAYLVLAPVTIPSGTTLTFTIETENYDIVKTITAPADMVMPAGNVAVINLSIAKENCTAKVEDTSDYSGEWLITGVKDEQVYAASAYVSGNNLKSVAISIENGQILEVDGIANCMMTLTKVADGDYAGMYTITDVNDKYLYAASSSGNQLKGATEVSVNAYWTVELQENGTYSIVASESSNRNVMQFNGNDILFNCYSSSSQNPVTLYPYSMVKADTTPRIYLEKTSDQVGADGTSYEFKYTTKNITGDVKANVKDGATMTNVSASASDGTVTVTFDANTDSETKSSTIVLSYEGAVSQEFVLTQNGKPAEGTPTTVTDKLVASLFAATSTSYSNFSGVSVTSPAVYAGNSAKTSSGGIQLRSNNNTSGIVTTTSGGKAKTITVTWASGNTSGRTLDIYGKSTAYSAASDLYNSNNQGTKLGSIKEGTSTKLEITGDYEFIGLRSNSGAMYLTSIEITWETNAGSGSGETTDPETPGEGGGNEGGETPTPDPDPTPDQPGEAGTSTISVTFADYTAGTQYATNEEHKINDVLTLYTTDCHFTSELRIYSSSTNNGYVISNQLPGKITQMTFNAGNKVDKLVVYGSIDGSSWTEVGEVSVTSTSYKDYTFSFGETNYTYFKLDVKGSNQVRLKKMSVTYLQ